MNSTEQADDDNVQFHDVRIHLPGSSDWCVIVPRCVTSAADAPADAINVLKHLFATPIEQWVTQIYQTHQATTLEIK